MPFCIISLVLFIENSRNNKDYSISSVENEPRNKEYDILIMKAYIPFYDLYTTWTNTCRKP